MTEAGIDDGALVLVRQQETAPAGTIVLALIDDEVTIKELRLSSNAAALVPRSKDKAHKSIVLTREFHLQGIVVATVPELPD